MKKRNRMFIPVEEIHWKHKMLRIMKLTFILIFCTLFTLLAENTYSQNAIVTIHEEDVTIQEILNEIEEQTEYLFLYNKRNVNVTRRTTVHSTRQPVSKVLELVLRESDVDYEMVGDHILLSNQMEKGANVRQQSSRIITGTVTDNRGEAIIGANIIEKGTTNGVVTDFNGEFSIIVGGNSILQVSYIGYIAQEIPVSNLTNYLITLIEDSQTIDEVVVVGYGIQKKATVTGSISQIGGKEIRQAPTSNLSNTLAGRMPGIIANNRSGEPGNDMSEIYIRGQGTLGNNSPLFVIDGVANRGGMIDNKDPMKRANPLERLNPNDIESITVLKDASAAIYGAQAANGVILITTKRGQSGKPTISYEGNMALSQNTRTPNVMNAYQYMVYDDEANKYQGRDQIWQNIKNGYLDGTIDPLLYADTDWFDATLRTFAPQTQHSLSIRGGNEQVRYYISGGYLYQEPGYKDTNINYNTIQVRSNLDAQITKDLSVSLELAARRENNNRSNYDSNTFFYEAFMAYPYLPDYYPNGLPGPGISWGNNLALLAAGKTGYEKIKDNYLNTKVNFDLKLPWIVDGLYVSGYGAFDSRFKETKKLNNMWDAYRYNPDTKEYDNIRTQTGDYNINLREQYDNETITTFHAKLGFEKRFNNHSVNAFIAYEQSKAKGNWFNAFRRDFLSSSVDYLFAGSDNLKDNDGSATISARQNYFGRLSYGYMDRYLIEFTLRHDGSQNFASGKRWGTFPGLSVGWRVSEEAFFQKQVPFINELKLRASWGKLGNDRVNPFQYLSAYEMNDGLMLGADPKRYKGFTLARISNPNITWEKVDTKNIGFESQFLNGLIGFDFEYFHSFRKDILTKKNASIPDYTGLVLPDQNIGEVSNQGVEMSLTHRKRINKVDYYIGGNFTFARNKIKFFDEAANVPGWQKETGFPMNSWLLYKTDGIYQTQEEVDSTPHLMNAQPGDIKYVDVDGDDEITANDMVRIHQSPVPEIVYGINMGASWKGFELNILWTGQAKAKQLIKPFGYNLDVDYFNNRWISATETPDSKYPRAFNTQDQINTKNSDFWLKDASFLRLKNVELAYNLPSSLLEKIKCQHVRLYISGFNLFSIDKIKILDPEGTHESGMYYPQQRIYNIGLTISF
ncbi:MAG: TonB-dependent receptor [Tannerellaceae bacterium]|jgi:TonB-linked SusC/RagA family outer membrane protein|nr:TonB-dependent receptor [Tannerellaceae bacterium]